MDNRPFKIKKTIEFVSMNNKKVKGEMKIYIL